MNLEQSHRAACETIRVHEADVSGDMQNDTFPKIGSCKTIGYLFVILVFRGFVWKTIGVFYKTIHPP
jgi:hypothetical protein